MHDPGLGDLVPEARVRSSVHTCSSVQSVFTACIAENAWARCLSDFTSEPSFLVLFTVHTAQAIIPLYMLLEDEIV